ncbi:MAG: YqaJ viral recombinase family protein [Candidatus Atribacteria bacterium]|nr:YqaJ viral recombinase family protein [Candidatus Atribacteria bacterium]MBE3145037.1 YqaJ viral recombinase family protein [Planctomycetota bacterium]
MSLTAEQRKERHKHLGSSDLPAILGFSRFSNKYDVWLEKTQRVQPAERTQNYITAGNLLERPVINWCADYLKRAIITDEKELERKVEGTPIVTHMDGIVVEGDPVEAKTEGVDHPIIEPWGEAGTDEIPEHVLLQAHCHMMATDREICHIPTFLGGRGFGYFFARRDEGIVKLIREQAIRFWTENVLGDKAPENVVPSLNMIKQIRRVVGEPVPLAEKMVQQWLDAKERAAAAKKQQDFFQAEILAALDGHDMGLSNLGDITNLEQSRKGYVVEPTSFRAMRLKKRK